MTSESKMRKVKRKLHYNRSSAWGGFLKEKMKGIKGVSFFNASFRKRLKKISME